MAYTLFDALVDLCPLLTDTWEGSATGGTTTTVVDTKLSGYYPDDYFNQPQNGVLLVNHTTPAIHRITDYVDSTQTITFTPAKAASAYANATQYWATAGWWPQYALINAVNQALRGVGKYKQYSEVTATADQIEYDSDDDAVFTKEVVEMEQSTATASPWYWMPHKRWKQTVKDDGKRTLLFTPDEAAPTAAYKLRVYYVDFHARVDSADDTIDAAIHPERLKWEAAVHALRWRVQKTKGDDDHLLAMLNEAKAEQALMAVKHRIKPPKPPQYSRW